MYNDFIQIKTLEGELKLSHKTRDFGTTVSTKEIVFHKPHMNYYIRFEDLISITPFEMMRRSRVLPYVNQESHNWNWIGSSNGLRQHYRFYVQAATVHNRSGIHRLGTMEFIVPVHQEILQMIASYSSLNLIP